MKKIGIFLMTLVITLALLASSFSVVSTDEPSEPCEICGVPGQYGLDDPTTLNLDESRINHNTIYYLTDEGWAGSSVTYDCYPDYEGWGDDQWELTLTYYSFVTIKVEDCCITGDYYEVYIDTELIGTTPIVDYYGAVLSVGEFTVELAPGTYFIEVRDAAFGTYPDLCPAGYDVTITAESLIDVEKEIVDAQYYYDISPYFTPVEIITNAWWDLQITVTNNGDTTLEDIWVYDSLGAHIKLVIQEPGTDNEYIFTLETTPIPLDEEDDIYFGNYNDEIIWKQANKKDPIKNPCATNLMWYIDELVIGESATLKFRVETILFPTGNKNSPVWKQAFTSTCHHSLNDGAIAVDEFEGEYYDYWSNPVYVSVYDDVTPKADSDSDGIYDMEEVTVGDDGYITDPCDPDTDGDGVSDKYEIDHGSDPTDPEIIPPYFIKADLQYSTDLLSWDPTSDYDYSDYEVELDCSVAYYALDLDEVEVAGGFPLADGYHEFYLDVTSLPSGFYDWWETEKGVTAGETPGSWEEHMWDIINGLEPMFYIKVGDASDEYMLLDGLQKDYFLTEQYLVVDGIYPRGTYTFTGTITNTFGAWDDVTITIEFTYLPTEFSGTFTSIRYLPGVWNYDIYLVRDCAGELISGTITFTDPAGVVIDASVSDVKDNYAYWYNMPGVSKPNLAAVGTATYGSYTGKFMFLSADSHIWMALSHNDYTTEWNSGTVWQTGRDYDILGADGGYWP